MTEFPRPHRWSGWPGAFCLDCGMEDALELSLAGEPHEVHHRYLDVPHSEQPCQGCAEDPCYGPIPDVKVPRGASHD